MAWNPTPEVQVARDAAKALTKAGRFIDRHHSRLSYYVETGAMENTGLDREVRFATRMEAERALRTLEARADRNGRPPTIEESAEPPTVTFEAWNEDVS